MSFLSRFIPEPKPPEITEENVVYNAEGHILCPRCEQQPSISMVGRRSRELTCMNCGYAGFVADGVEIYNGDPEWLK